MRTLEVYLAGKPVGTIAETRRGCRFTYNPDIYETLPGTPVLSMSFLAKRKPFGESKTRNWFEGLLPEGERRDRACRQLGLDSGDWLGLLAQIGWECAGAVQVFSEGKARERYESYLPIDQAELAVKLKDTTARQSIEGEGTFRMSLGGYQDKLCVYMPCLPKGQARVSPTGTCLTLGDAPSTHILKPEPARYPGIAESEAWAMTAARAAARCAKVALLDLEDCPQTLVVERYDRRLTEDGMVFRLHQEDTCQALGLPITAKYANETQAKGNDPTYRGIAELLDRYGVDATSEKLELLRQLTVNIALGNWDAHAKNTSFLYPKLATPVVAPLYDVVPIAEVEPRASLLSLRVNGSLDPGTINGAALVEEALTWGLGAAEARGTIMNSLEALDEGLTTASDLYPDAAARHEQTARLRIARLAVGCRV